MANSTTKRATNRADRRPANGKRPFPKEVLDLRTIMVERGLDAKVSWVVWKGRAAVRVRIVGAEVSMSITCRPSGPMMQMLGAWVAMNSIRTT